MSIIIKNNIDSKDYNSAIDFGIEGFNFRDYCQGIDLYFYSKYVFYNQLLKATRIYSAYDNDKFVGFLLVEINDEKKKVENFWMKLFVKTIETIIIILYGTKGYYSANKIIYDEYTKTNKPNGEILLFVVDPKMKGKGIGTLLLKEMEKDLKNKEVFLYTDIGCTYQIYEHRGFTKEQEIEYFDEFKKGLMKCFLYSKKIK